MSAARGSRHLCRLGERLSVLMVGHLRPYWHTKEVDVLNV